MSSTNENVSIEDPTVGGKRNLAVEEAVKEQKSKKVKKSAMPQPTVKIWGTRFSTDVAEEVDPLEDVVDRLKRFRTRLASQLSEMNQEIELKVVTSAPRMFDLNEDFFYVPPLDLSPEMLELNSQSNNEDKNCFESASPKMQESRQRLRKKPYVRKSGTAFEYKKMYPKENPKTVLLLRNTLNQKTFTRKQKGGQKLEKNTEVSWAPTDIVFDGLLKTSDNLLKIENITNQFRPFGHKYDATTKHHFGFQPDLNISTVEEINENLLISMSLVGQKLFTINSRLPDLDSIAINSPKDSAAECDSFLDHVTLNSSQAIVIRTLRHLQMSMNLALLTAYNFRQENDEHPVRELRPVFTFAKDLILSIECKSLVELSEIVEEVPTIFEDTNDFSNIITSSFNSPIQISVTKVKNVLPVESSASPIFDFLARFSLPRSL